MKSLAKFILIYFLCFFVSSVLTVLFFEDSSYTEMLGYAISGCLLYSIVCSLGWLIVYRLLRNIKNKTIRFISFLISGFTLLDGLLFYLTDGGHARPMMVISINIIHAFCFLIAYLLSSKTRIVQPTGV